MRSGSFFYWVIREEPELTIALLAEGYFISGKRFAYILSLTLLCEAIYHAIYFYLHRQRT